MTTTIAVKPNRNPGSFAKNLNRSVGYTVLIVVTVLLFIPIAWLLVSTLKLDNEYMAYPIQFLPTKFHWENYVQVFTMTKFGTVALRTFILGAVVSVLSALTSAMGGFAFARFHVPGNKQLFSIIIALLIVPGIVFTIPQFILFARLKLTNTYWPWILGAISASPYAIFFYRQFFLSFPRELEEAAEIDGCGPLRMFWQIFMPNAKPVIAVVMIGAFNGVWGDYITPLIYLSETKTLLGVILATGFKNPKGIVIQTVNFAATVYYVLPLIVVFFMAQKHILKGIITSGLKG